MKTIAGSLLLLPVLLLLGGCVTLYKPNAIHSPMLTAKGEGHASATVALSGSGLYNLQSAYALTDNLGFMLDGMYHSRHSNSNDTTVEKLNIYFVEGGIGRIQPLGVMQKSFLQCYAGGGYGHTSDVLGPSGPNQPQATASYFNAFFQPGILYTSDNYRLAFDLRANYVRLFEINAYMYDNFEWWNTDFQYYKGATLDFLLLEPALTLRLGKGHFSGLMQVGLTVPAYHAKSYFNINNVSMLVFPLIKLSAGFTYTFGGK